MLSDTPSPPIYVWEPGDLTIFSTIENAESHLEAIDVLANSYVAFDRRGYHLLLEVKRIKERGIIFTYTVDAVLMRLDPDQAGWEGALKRILCEYIPRVRDYHIEDLLGMDLDALQSLATTKENVIR